MSMRKNQKSFTVSTLIALFIVVMLVISVPAQAVSVIISGLGGTYTKGNSIEFTVSVNITDPDKYVPAANISLDVAGPVNLSRAFALDGTPISGNPAITITPVHIPQPNQFGYGYGYGVDSGNGTGYSFGYGYGYGHGYGYGYGYGYGAGGGTVTYTYNVTINTTSLSEGNYSAVANLNTGKAVKPAFTSAEATFEITTVPEPKIKPKIISWGNDKTGDASLSITVNKSETVRFNATADQVITEWEWNVDNDEQNNNFDNLSYRFDAIGSHEVEVVAKNDNGTSDDITWVIDVKDTPPTSPIQVTIEINPETIDPKSKGVVTVFVLNNMPAGFNIANIDVSTVKFGPGNASVINSNIAGDKLILKFNTEDTGIQCSDTQATLTGKTYSGQDIIGSENITTIECGGGAQDKKQLLKQLLLRWWDHRGGIGS